MIKPAETQNSACNLLRLRQLPSEVIQGYGMTQVPELIFKTTKYLGKSLAQVWPRKPALSPPIPGHSLGADMAQGPFPPDSLFTVTHFFDYRRV